MQAALQLMQKYWAPIIMMFASALAAASIFIGCTKARVTENDFRTSFFKAVYTDDQGMKREISNETRNVDQSAVVARISARDYDVVPESELEATFETEDFNFSMFIKVNSASYTLRNGIRELSCTPGGTDCDLTFAFTRKNQPMANARINSANSLENCTVSFQSHANDWTQMYKQDGSVQGFGFIDGNFQESPALHNVTLRADCFRTRQKIISTRFEVGKKINFSRVE